MPRVLLLLLIAIGAQGVELADDAWLASLHPALSEAGVADLARVPSAARGEAELELDEALPGLRGRMRLRWTNPGPDAVPDLLLNCWPNAPAFGGARLELTAVTLDGQPATPVAEGGGERLRLALPRPLPPGGSVLLAAQVAAAVSPAGYHGLMMRSPDGTWVFSGFLPEPSVRIGGAWRAEPLAGMADALRTHAAHWRLRLRLPLGHAVAGPGSEIARSQLPDGRSEVELAAPLSRNLCLVVGAGLQTVERQADGVTVRMWHRPQVRLAAVRAAEACAASLRRCGAAFGPYPFRELDAVEAPLEEDVGGVEASGLVLLGRNLCEMVGEIDPALPPLGLTSRMLAEAATHETAHQWWHLMVGNDTHLHPWLDESLTNWAGTWVLEAEYGAAIGPAWGLCLFAAPMGARQPPLTMTRPAGDYQSMAYGAVVYARGALMYQRLRHGLGDERFLAALRDWTDRHRWGWAEPEDWQAWLDRHAPKELAEEIRAKWLNGEGLTVQDMVKAAR